MFLFSKAYKTPISTYTDSYRPPCSVKKAQKNYRLEPLWRENKFVTQVNATQGGSLRVSTLGSCRCLMPGRVVAWGLMGCLAACVQWGGLCYLIRKVFDTPQPVLAVLSQELHPAVLWTLRVGHQQHKLSQVSPACQ